MRSVELGVRYFSYVKVCHEAKSASNLSSRTKLAKPVIYAEGATPAKI
jgi:hypothetical protein